jgi:hypothetical protein
MIIYLVNYDKQEYVDKGKCPITDYSWGNLKVHPLPLLTAEGNGRGGGDYHKESGMDYIGSWARCRLGLLEKLPEGFTEITPNFKENE